MMTLHRSEIWLADLSPQAGTEAGKIRPVLIVQTDGLNGHHPSTIICPITTNTKPQPNLLRVSLDKGQGGLKQKSDVMIDQLRAIDNRRFQKKLGTMPANLFQQVADKIRIALEL
jgi:mRNA interferase MazF